jgi:AmiR/NasT family two-component response regulator
VVALDRRHQLDRGIVVELGLIEAAPRPLRRGVSAPMAAHIAAIHRGWGTRLLTETGVRAVLGDGRAAAIETAGGEIIAADLAPLALELARWGAPNGEGLKFLDPPPAALPRELRSALSGKRSFWNALRKDLLDAPTDTFFDETAKSAPSPEEQERLRQELAVKRAGYIRRRHEQESRLNVGEQVWTIFENAEFARAPAPQISVIITLYNYASFIEGCVEAIDRSADLLANICKAARRIYAERPIPIVMLTAYGQDELVSRAVEAGVFGYLVKPFREQDLLPAIHAARARHEELTALREEAESLSEALEARKVIERAKGLLMTKENLSEEEAFARLRKASQVSGRPLRVVAEAVLATFGSQS